MAFKFYIDGQLTDQPENDMALSTLIKRDSEMGGFLITQEVTLAYSNDNAPPTGTVSGFGLIKAAFDLGSCNEMEVAIYDELSPTETYRVFTGVIKVPSVEILEHIMKLSIKIEDNNFYAFLKNNRNIAFNPFATKSKNGILLTPPSQYDVDMFASQNGVFGSASGNYFKGFRLYDLLAFLIPALSDNKVTFASDFLTATDTQLFLFDGYSLAHANQDTRLLINFDNIIKELFKLKNTSFFIDQTDPDNPVFRLEDANYFFNQSNVLTFDEPFEIKTSIKSTKIFGTVNVGSEFNPGGAGVNYTFNAGTSYFGWKDEIYTPLGQCNTDNELDLMSEWAIASNAINDQLLGALTENMETTFCVECENVDTVNATATAVAYEIFGNGIKRFYNLGLNNVTKVNLHSGNFQSALTNTEDAGGDIFRASLGQDEYLANFNPGGTGNNYTILPLIFADEFGGSNYDPGGNYNNLTGIYVAPADGDYSFSINLVLDVANCKECAVAEIRPVTGGGSPIFTNVARGIEIISRIIAYSDATLTTIIASSQNVYRTFINTPVDIQLALPVTLPTGANVLVATTATAMQWAPNTFGNTPLSEVQPVPYYVYNGCGYGPGEPNITVIADENSTYECNGTPTGGIVLADPDPSVYKVRLHEFKYDISASDFRSIQALPLGLFTFIKDGVSRNGYIEELQYNNWTTVANVKLITNDATS